MSAELSKWPSLEGVVISTDSWTAPYWEAAADHRLVVQRCTNCGESRLPPTPFCPHCSSQACEWPELSGRGTIYSYTLVTKAVGSHQIGHVPYVPALIEPIELPKVRIVSTVVDAPLDEIHIGDRVEVVWHDGPNGLTVPRFRLEPSD